MLKKTLEMFTPPEKWKIPILLTLGVFAGFSAYTLYLSRFYSYLGEGTQNLCKLSYYGTTVCILGA